MGSYGWKGMSITAPPSSTLHFWIWNDLGRQSKRRGSTVRNCLNRGHVAHIGPSMWREGITRVRKDRRPFVHVRAQLMRLATCRLPFRLALPHATRQPPFFEKLQHVLLGLGKGNRRPVSSFLGLSTSNCRQPAEFPILLSKKKRKG